MTYGLERQGLRKRRRRGRRWQALVRRREKQRSVVRRVEHELELVCACRCRRKQRVNKTRPKKKHGTKLILLLRYHKHPEIKIEFRTLSNKVQEEVNVRGLIINYKRVVNH